MPIFILAFHCSFYHPSSSPCSLSYSSIAISSLPFILFPSPLFTYSCVISSVPSPLPSAFLPLLFVLPFKSHPILSMLPLVLLCHFLLYSSQFFSLSPSLPLSFILVFSNNPSSSIHYVPFFFILTLYVTISLPVPSLFHPLPVSCILPLSTHSITSVPSLSLFSLTRRFYALIHSSLPSRSLSYPSITILSLPLSLFLFLGYHVKSSPLVPCSSFLPSRPEKSPPPGSA